MPLVRDLRPLLFQEYIHIPRENSRFEPNLDYSTGSCVDLEVHLGELTANENFTHWRSLHGHIIEEEFLNTLSSGSGLWALGRTVQRVLDVVHVVRGFLVDRRFIVSEINHFADVGGANVLHDRPIGLGEACEHIISLGSRDACISVDLRISHIHVIFHGGELENVFSAGAGVVDLGDGHDGTVSVTLANAFEGSEKIVPDKGLGLEFLGDIF